MDTTQVCLERKFKWSGGELPLHPWIHKLFPVSLWAAPLKTLCCEILPGSLLWHVTDSRNIAMDFAQPPIDGWAAGLPVSWHKTLQKLLWISLKEDGKKPEGVVQPPISPFDQSIVTIHEALFENLCCQRSWVCALMGQRHEVDLHNIRQGAHQHVQMRTELLAPCENSISNFIKSISQVSLNRVGIFVRAFCYFGCLHNFTLHTETK